MAYLVVTVGSNKGAEFKLNSENVQLGRHPSCEITVEDSAVSRHHAEIQERGGYYYLSDLDSRNGTQVNGTDVKNQRQLNHNDEIQICDTILRFKIDADSSNRSSIDNGKTSILEFFEDRGGQSSIQKSMDPDSSYKSDNQKLIQRKLTTLIGITKLLSSTLVLDDVIPKVLDSLFTFFPQAGRAFIILADEEGELGRHWWRDVKGDDETFRISRTIIQDVIKSGKALLAEDATLGNERFNPSMSIHGINIRSVMCAPMINAEGKCIGCVQIDTLESARSFRSDDLDMLNVVAMQCGIAVQNALMHETAVDQSVIENDLKIAREIQFRLLPKKRPNLEGFEFFHFYEPANLIGGDYFDYIPLRDGRLCVIVADVAGHGIASAVLMAKFSAEVRYALLTQPSVGKAVEEINNVIISHEFKRFVTMLLMVVDPETGVLTIVNAGHMDPLVRVGNEVTAISREIASIPIGIMPDNVYPEMQFQLEKNSTILLYTDGVNEAMDHDKKQYGNQRIIDVISECENRSEVIGQTLIDSVSDHRDVTVDQDDTCLVCIGRV